MSHLSYLIFSCFLFLSQPVFSQKKWDGGGGNNLWNNPLNWSGNTLPVSTDNVLFDNSVVIINYTIQLPSTSVTVKSISISPAVGKTIELILPSQNTLSPGLTVNGPGYGLTINSGGIFRNSSGAASGNAVKISDSIRINNDGRYIHNTFSGHSSNVQVLSTAPGTENGIMELNIPAASSTISLSGRTFGKLVLRSTAAGGNCNYTAAGSNRVLIRNNLELQAGVNLNLNFSDTIFVHGDLSQESGTLNLGNSIKSVVLQVGQNVMQAVGGIITETGAGTQSIVFSGSGLHLLALRGSLLNRVAMVNSGGGIILLKSAISLPFKLSIKSGRMITSDEWLLTLQSSCIIEADSLSEDGFIAGPLRKEGLNNSSFLFPVGKSTRKRWIRLEQATGSFTVEYFRANPYTLSNSIGSGLHHVSTVEYWDVLSSSGANATVKLSFSDPHSGGVTSLSALRVSRLAGGTWQNAGNVNMAGNPGSNGWVSSAAAGGFSANNKSFALASAISQENPLPFFDFRFSAVQKDQNILFRWQLQSNDFEPGVFELQESPDGKTFTSFQTIAADSGKEYYSFGYTAPYINSYYRLRMRTSDGAAWYESKPFHLQITTGNGWKILGSNRVAGTIRLSVSVPEPVSVCFAVYNYTGAISKILVSKLKAGNSLVTLDLSALKPGLYFLSETTGTLKNRAQKIIKF